MLKEMGVFRVVGFLALLTACDKGKLEPTKGSAQPTPAPLPSPDPAPLPDASSESIDEQLLNGKTPDVWVRACNDTGEEMTKLEWHDDFKEPLLPNGWCTRFRPTKGAYGYKYAAFHIGNTEYRMQPIDYVGETPLAAGHWSYHIKNLDPTHRIADIHADADKLTDDPWSNVRVCNDTASDITVIAGPVSTPDVKKHACSESMQVSRADSAPSLILESGGKRFFSGPFADAIRPLPPVNWSYHVTRLAGDDITYDARPDVK